MVKAGEDLAVPRTLPADLGPPVPAGVDQDPHLAVPTPGEDHRLATDAAGVEVVGAGQLRLVTDIEPGPVEDELTLPAQDVVGDEDLTVDAEQSAVVVVHA